MGIVTSVKARREVPHEPGEWVEIRKLSWRQLEEARDAQTTAMFGQMKEMGGDLISAIRSAAPSADAQEAQAALQKAAADPLGEYHLPTLLRLGIASWSYDAELPDGVDYLDEQTARWAALEIVEFTAGRRSEEERGEGSSPST